MTTSDDYTERVDAWYGHSGQKQKVYSEETPPVLASYPLGDAFTRSESPVRLMAWVPAGRERTHARLHFSAGQ